MNVHIIYSQGRPTPVTWTVLSETAPAGTNILNLKVPVNWLVGDWIIIATTGDHMSQHQNEKHRISDISADGLTLTLEENLAYDHKGETETYGDVHLDLRAEVGLLTHNVVFRGSNDAQWNVEIKACPAEFDPGLDDKIIFIPLSDLCMTQSDHLKIYNYIHVHRIH